MTSFTRSRKLSDLWHLAFWRKSGAVERSKDCHPRTTPKTCSTSDVDPCRDPCKSPPPPPPKQTPPCFYPSLSVPYPDADPSKVIFWRMLSLFVALPIVVVMSAITYVHVEEELKKPREPYLNLPYMQRRTKPFPWGDGNHSLFHNPVKNPVPPHGYEVEDPYKIVHKKKNN